MKYREYGKNRKHKNHTITKEQWESCKAYFNYKCAYCGLSLQEHYETVGTDFHKEHVIHDGANDLSNCVPSCKGCNGEKWEYSIDEWYIESNPRFNQDNLDKIKKWLNEDYLIYI